MCNYGHLKKGTKKKARHFLLNINDTKITLLLL